MEKVVAVIPARNEEKTIADIVKFTANYVDEVIVVDDRSSDKTGIIAKRKGAKVIKTPINKGLGYVLRFGYKYALGSGADIIVTLDADGQHNPNDIPKLIERLKEAHVVLGSRFLGKNKNVTNPIKNILLSYVLSILLGIKLSDTQTGFRVFRRECLENLNPIGDSTIRQEEIILAVRKGFKIAEVPITVSDRRYGKSFVNFTYPFKVLPIIISAFLRRLK